MIRDFIRTFAVTNFHELVICFAENVLEFIIIMMKRNYYDYIMTILRYLLQTHTYIVDQLNGVKIIK